MVPTNVLTQRCVILEGNLKIIFSDTLILLIIKTMEKVEKVFRLFLGGIKILSNISSFKANVRSEFSLSDTGFSNTLCLPPEGARGK